MTGSSFVQRTARPTAVTSRALLRPGGAYHSVRSRYRMVDGKISEIWEEADLLGLMQQLGATVTRKHDSWPPQACAVAEGIGWGRRLGCRMEQTS